MNNEQYIGLEDKLKMVSSVLTRDLLIEYLGEDPKKLFELWKIIKKNDPSLSNRGTWVLYSYFEKHPGIVQTYVKEIIIFLEKCVNPGTRRNLLKIIAETHVGLFHDRDHFIDSCFKWMTGNEPVSVKVQSMQILYNISEKIPEIKHELLVSIENNLEMNSIGFKNRGQRLIRKIRKQIQDEIIN